MKILHISGTRSWENKQHLFEVIRSNIKLRITLE
jgi:hypothetical protein